MKEVRSGYKRTKVGVIPMEWAVKKLGEICDSKIGLTYSPDDVVDSKGLLVLRSSNIRNGSLVYEDNVFVNKEVKEELLTKENDILICARNGSKSLIGKNALITSKAINLTFGAFMSIYRSEYNKFLFQMFQTELYKKQISINLGATINQITTKNLNDFIFPIPPIHEQEKIAEILSTWDSAIEKQEQLIEKKKEFKKGLMQNLYSKGTKKEMLVKSKLGEVPESWKIVKAKEVFKSVSIKNNENEELLSVTQDKGTIPRSQLEGNVVMPEGSTRGYKLVVPNNFIISLRSFQGGLEISKHRGIISPAYTVLDNKIEICHDYFKYYFKKEEFISRLNGAIVGIRDGKQISYADFGEMFLPVPSLEEQIKIAEILMVADKEIELLEKELEALKLQKKGLMQRLLTGEVRVKV